MLIRLLSLYLQYPFFDIWFIPYPLHQKICLQGSIWLSMMYVLAYNMRPSRY